MEGKGYLGVPMVESRQPTEGCSPQLATKDRAAQRPTVASEDRPAAEFHAQPVDQRILLGPVCMSGSSLIACCKLTGSHALPDPPDQLCGCRPLLCSPPGSR